MTFRKSFLISLFVAVISGFQCPNGSSQVPQENYCIYASADTDFYPNVFWECSALSGIPAKLSNIFENSFAFAMIPDRQNGAPPYIGVEKGKDNTWTYADGTPLIYANWAPNEPIPSNTSICTIMDPQTGQWKAADCTVARPYLCSIDGNNLPITTPKPHDPHCQDGWVYSDQTKYCYFLQNFTLDNNGKWILYNWTQAEANCQKMGAHLISIHSRAEELLMYDLITANVANLTQPDKYNHSCDSGQWTWNGLYGTGNIGNGNWSDGTTVDYYGDCPRTGFEAYWTMCNDASCGCHGWDWALGTRDNLIPRYVCKIASKGKDETKS